MKILYVTDRYGWDNWGTKPSLYEALRSRVDVDLHLRDYLPPGVCPLNTRGYTHIFYASTGCIPPAGQIAVKVGFGFSDPLHLEITKKYWSRFNHYFSLSNDVVDAAIGCGLNAHQFLPAVSEQHYLPFQVDHTQAKYDTVMLGKIVGHPAEVGRRELVTRLGDRGLLGIAPSGLAGPDLFRHVAQARCGLNFIAPDGALSRTILEYAACGLCIVSNRDPRIDDMFEPWVEYLPADDPQLIEKLRDVDHCSKIGAAGRTRFLQDHTMARRVDDVLNVLGGV